MSESILHNEPELIRLVAQGDEAAYKLVFKFYWPRVYSAALLFTKVPELAEDAAQEVFAKLWVKRQLLTDVREFRAYLFTLARNHILNNLRTKVLTDEFNEYLEDYFVSAHGDPEAMLDIKEAERFIEDAVSKLPPQQQKVFRMSRFQGMTHEQICSVTGLSPRTVKNYMVNANLFLRNYLEKHSGTYGLLLWMFVV